MMIRTTLLLSLLCIGQAHAEPGNAPDTKGHFVMTGKDSYKKIQDSADLIEIERRRRLVDNARKFCEWATALRNSWTDWDKIAKP